MPLPVEYEKFDTREARSRFVAHRFADYLKGSILDVGCFNAPLRDILKFGTYTGIDMAGCPDLVVNLEETEHLPFENGMFDCVLCIDVLEHLDNLHAIFSELIRVSGCWIIVSLPNCWCNARRPIEKGKGKFSHYGLPLEKPVDRHKWFFSLSEAIAFIEGKVNESGLQIADMFISEKPRNAIARLARKAMYSRVAYQNRYSGTLWAVLQKPA